MANKIIGSMDKETAKEMSLDICSRCGSKDIVAVLEVPDKIKELKITKLYPACKKCCDETGVSLK